MHKSTKILKCSVVPAITLAALAFSPVVRAQTSQQAQPSPGSSQNEAPAKGQQNENIHLDGWDRPAVPEEATGRKPGPAPVHDLSGIWEPVPRYRDGVFASGPREMPGDAKHEAMMPYTPEGKAAFQANKPGFGTTAAPVAEINDPFDICDPIGLPRVLLFNLRGLQIVQTANQVLMLYQNTRVWRNIWTDGRELPKDITENRWFGYSVGKWVDNNTLVVQTNGLDDRTWIDNVGRPHSDALVVEETYHRVDEFNIELTVKITDPKMYTKPWIALDKFRLGLNSPTFDIREMICSASEQAQYNQLLHEAVPIATDK